MQILNRRTVGLISILKSNFKSESLCKTLHTNNVITSSFTSNIVAPNSNFILAHMLKIFMNVGWEIFHFKLALSIHKNNYILTLVLRIHLRCDPLENYSLAWLKSILFDVNDSNMNLKNMAARNAEVWWHYPEKLCALQYSNWTPASRSAHASRNVTI